MSQTSCDDLLRHIVEHEIIGIPNTTGGSILTVCEDGSLVISGVDKIDFLEPLTATASGLSIIRIGLDQTEIDHLLLLNAGTNTHTDIDIHISTTGIHFADAPVDNEIYVRRDGVWIEIEQIDAADLSSASAIASGEVPKSDGTGGIDWAPLFGEAAFHLPNPGAAEEGYWYRNWREITVTEVAGLLAGITPSVDFNVLYHETFKSPSATKLFTSDQSLTATGPSTIFVPNVTTIPAAVVVWVTTSAASGTIEEINVDLNITL